MKQSRWLAVLFGLAIVLALAGVRGADGFVAETIRNLTFDQYQQWSPRKATPQPVRVIDIDEASLEKIGQFPWPRTEFAKLVDGLQKLGAAAIVFDVIFSESDRLSPSQILKRDDLSGLLTRAGKDRPTEKLIDNDRIFAVSIAKAPVVLAFGPGKAEGSRQPTIKSGIAFTGKATLNALHDTGPNTTTIQALEQAATGMGSISVSPEGGQDVIRQTPMMWAHKGKAYPSLVMESLRVAQGASTFIIKGAEAGHEAVEEIKIGAVPVKTTRRGELWMYYRKNTQDLYVPAHEIIQPKAGDDTALRAKIQGHIVFVGTSAAGLFDIKTTSLDESVPGVSVHAQAVEQILSQTFLWRPDWIDGLEISLVVAIGLLIVFAATFLTPLTSFAIGIVVAILLAAGSWFGFRNYGLLFDPTFPLVSGLLVHFAMTAYRYLVTDKEARFVRMAFSRYVSSDVLEEIQTDPQALELGGDTRQLTIMFVDIRNFTPLSEGLSPQDLVAFLNKLLGELSQCVTSEKGTIDKYIGDSIMAFWNAPVAVENHQRRACAAALKMRATLERLNRDDAFGFRKNGLPFGDIAIGVGINTGEACVGNLGSLERFDYSIIGDAVNVASRTESSCKELAMDILMTASTAAAVSEFACLDAGKIPLKGKSQDQQIFTLVGDESVRNSDRFQALLASHEELMAQSEKGLIEAAAQQCKTLAADILPRLAAFYDKLKQRLINPNAPTQIRMGKKSS